MGAFHAYDIRGVFGVDFDGSTAYKVGYFLPELLSADKVLVGRDCRVSSDEIHDRLLEGITDAGADVYDVGHATTPMVYFGTANYGFEASVQITASHNPAEYNGMKVSSANALPVGLDNGLGQIRTWIEEERACPPAGRKGQVYQKDIRKDYLDFLMKYKGDYSDLKIAMDLSNGMSTLFAKEIFGTAPAYIFDEMDGRFPNHEPNPLIPKNVEALQELVRKTKADIGVIYDGDADRVMFVDENGRFISPDLWKVGRAFAARKLRELDGVYGGELAGHYYFRDFFYSDSGLLASILVLNVVASMKKKGISVSALIGNIEKYRNSGEINFRVEDKKGAMDAVRDYFTSAEKPEAMMDFDGYRVEFPDWWFNIRPSNTEPYLRFICEAVSDSLLDEKVTAVTRLLSEKFGATRS